MRIALLLTIGSLLFCGCRVNPNAEREIALLRAEILDLEDQYYSLKSQRDNAVVQLRDCQGTSFDDSQFPNQSSGDCLDCDNGAVFYDSSPIVYEDAIIGGGVIHESNDAPGMNSMDQLQPFESGSPIIDTENEIEDDGAGRARENTSIFNRRNSLSSSSVSAIRIHQQASKGVDLDGIAGHEGLSLLVQPIDRQGAVVRSVGQMTVQVLERDRLASSRQIGFWRFTPEEIQNFQVREDLPNQGVLLHLPWSQMLPTRNNVNVVINFVTSGNVRLSGKLQIAIQPPTRRYSLDEPLIANWIENDERWNNPDSGFEQPSEPFELGPEFGQPNFQNASESRGTSGDSVEPESDRRTSVPRWRPVR